MQSGVTTLNWIPQRALPAWSQQQVVLSDGVSPDQRYNECGETCVSMVVAAVWGVPVSPDAFRSAVNGVYGSGLTTAEQLLGMLRYGNVQGKTSMVTTTGLRPFLDRVAADGRSCIILGKWPTPGGVLHWLLTESPGDGRLNYINPWGGVRSWMPWSDVQQYYAGSVVEVSAHYHFDKSAMALPW